MVRFTDLLWGEFNTGCLAICCYALEVVLRVHLFTGLPTLIRVYISQRAPRVGDICFTVHAHLFVFHHTWYASKASNAKTANIPTPNSFISKDM
jgi:hypothetical protein